MAFRDLPTTHEMSHLFAPLSKLSVSWRKAYVLFAVGTRVLAGLSLNTLVA
jgi:hypothetical protein